MSLRFIKRSLNYALVAFAIFAILPAARSFAGETINVAAAISLREAVEEIGKSFEKETDDHVEFTFGSSGQLMTQIKGGAPVDLFISAAATQADELEKSGLIKAETRRTIVTNSLVLIIPKSADAKLWDDGFKTLGTDSAQRIAIGEPKTVPAGQYAMQVLSNMKLSNGVETKLVYGTNVRQVLSYVERGEVSAGIVYATDAILSGDKVKIVATADDSTHDAIVYPAAVVTASQHQAVAVKLLNYLRHDEAKAIFIKRGFIPDKPPTTAPSNSAASTDAPPTKR